MLDNYHELMGILNQIEKKDLGEVNKVLNDLRKKVEAFLDKYDKDKNRTIDIFELIEKRDDLSTDLGKENKVNEGVSQLGNIVKTTKELEDKITKYRQGTINQANNNQQNIENILENNQEQETHAVVEIQRR